MPGDPLPPIRALVVHQTPAVVAALVGELERLGCDVTAVGSGEEAVGALERMAPELVVTGILLVGFDGRLLIDLLRSRDATVGCRVVTATLLEPDDVGVPVDGRLRTPIHPAEVAAVVDPLLEAIRAGRGRRARANPIRSDAGDPGPGRPQPALRGQP